MVTGRKRGFRPNLLEPPSLRACIECKELFGYNAEIFKNPLGLASTLPQAVNGHPLLSKFGLKP